eukprot:4092660-Alexandrium_andersonii.AAC.1
MHEPTHAATRALSPFRSRPTDAAIEAAARPFTKGPWRGAAPAAPDAAHLWRALPAHPGCPLHPCGHAPHAVAAFRKRT